MVFNMEQSQRLREVRKILDKTQAEFGKQIGKGRTTIINWERSGEIPDDMFTVMENVYGISTEWLKAGDGKMFDVVPVHSTEHLRKEYKGRAHGTISDDDIIDADLISTEISGGSQENIRSIKFDNDSMEPTILKCAVCGVDTDDNILVDNKIYLIKFPNIGETIRRLQIKSNGVLVVADNKNVEPELLPVEVIESGVILGRVRWIHNKV